MDKEIFRKKSIDIMKSPDNLNEYIKVINPSLWIVFIAAFLLLLGAFIWGSVGKIEDKVSVTAISQNSVVICDYTEGVQKGMKAVIDGNEGYVSSVDDNKIILSFDRPISDGVYLGYIILGEISPISFVFN